MSDEPVAEPIEDEDVLGDEEPAGDGGDEPTTEKPVDTE